MLKGNIGMSNELYWLRRTIGGYAPADNRTEERSNKFKLDELVGTKFEKIRAPRHHRFYFAMLRQVLKQQEYYKSESHLLHGLKLYFGMIENEVILKDGRTTYELESIAFNRMDEIRFTELVKKTKDFIAAEVLPGITEAEMRREIEGFL